MAIYAGIDCGATHLRVGLVDESGRLIGSNKVSSPLKSRANQFAQDVKSEVDKLVAKLNCQMPVAYGIGTPGPVDLEKGLILPSANLHNDSPVDLRSQFNNLGLKSVVFDRDTNIALIGESWQGAARGKNEVVMLTLGSGIGGAIMVGGRIDRGATDKAGEIGHMFIEIPNTKYQIPNLPKCGLGHEGCFEAMVNSARDVTELAVYLGYGLASILNIFNPEMVVVGGGKLFMGDFLPRATAQMKGQTVWGVTEGVEIVYAKLKDLSGVYGGAKLAMEEIQK